MQNRLAVVGVGIVVFMVLFCFVGPLFYHTDQVDTNLANDFLAPSAKHLLGTDEDGFDVIGRLMIGGQTSLEIGIAAALIATAFGVLWGAVAGFFGGWVDNLLMRFVDVMLAIPALVPVAVSRRRVSPQCAHADHRRRRHRMADPGASCSS